MRKRYFEDNYVGSHSRIFEHHNIPLHQEYGFGGDPISGSNWDKQSLMRCDALLRDALELLDRLDEACCGTVEFMNTRVFDKGSGVTVLVPTTKEFLAGVGVTYTDYDITRAEDEDLRIWIPCGCWRCAQQLGRYVKERWG